MRRSYFVIKLDSVVELPLVSFPFAFRLTVYHSAVTLLQSHLAFAAAQDDRRPSGIDGSPGANKKEGSREMNRETFSRALQYILHISTCYNRMNVRSLIITIYIYHCA